MKQFISKFNKKHLLLVSIPLVCITAFSLYREGAVSTKKPIDSSKESINDTSSEKSNKLSTVSFDFNSEPVVLIKDSEGTHHFKTSDTVTLYSTSDTIIDFHVLSNNKIIYKSYKADMQTQLVQMLNLDSKETKIILEGTDILLDEDEGLWCAVDTPSKTMYVGDSEKANKLDIKEEANKISISKENIFILDYISEGIDNISTNITVFKNRNYNNRTTKHVTGRVTHINTDSLNLNKVYLSKEQYNDINPKIPTHIISYIFINGDTMLSNSENLISNKNGYIFSMKNENIFIDAKNNLVRKLNIDLEEGPIISSIYPSNYISTIKFNKDNTKMLYLDNTGTIKTYSTVQKGDEIDNE